MNTEKSRTDCMILLLLSWLTLDLVLWPSSTLDVVAAHFDHFNNHTPFSQEYFYNEINNILSAPLPLWEQSTLLNLNPFSWIIVNESLCKPDPNQPNAHIFPVLVHSARSHFPERMVIRNTWGSMPIYKNWDVRLVFLMGDQEEDINPEMNQKQFSHQHDMLKAEQEKFGDLVMGSFRDSYRNLTYKHLMGYKWILNFCQNNAAFVLKVDDDVFIDPMQWVDWRIDDLQKVKNNISTKPLPDLYCRLREGDPVRTRVSKWYVSKEEWPKAKYPVYCSGVAYGISVNLIRKIYGVSNDIKFLWVDDVFVSGVLLETVRKKLQWRPEIRNIHPSISFDIRQYRPFCENANWNAQREFPAVVAVPSGPLFERDMTCMWNKTLYDSDIYDRFT